MKFIDGGYVAWRTAYAMLNYGAKPWDVCDMLVEHGARLCMDSRESLRKQAHPWYKLNRNDRSDEPLYKLAHLWQRDALKRYDCLVEEGLEADDVVVLNYTLGDSVISEDKDFMQIPGIYMENLEGKTWGFERLQKKLVSCDLSTPEKWLAYQTMTGDPTDNIPRLLPTRDRKLLPRILGQQHPFELLMGGVVAPDVLKAQLDCLILPTPLYTGKNYKEVIHERYY